ncbi:unnamed protein product [Vicia faba]|uniref:Uncharacterized protein n=1 Tax=Vicia faba TaxID=3906 RepID=A0AAV0YJY8_VICFA|nr:unnamed protein product [Vicia faba]
MCYANLFNVNIISVTVYEHRFNSGMPQSVHAKISLRLACQKCIQQYSFDHVALRVEMMSSVETFDDIRKFIFHFEEVWSKDLRCEELIWQNWNGIFTSSSPSDIPKACAIVANKLSEEHKIWCDAMFSKGEMKKVLSHMYPTKALGPNGLPALFF